VEQPASGKTAKKNTWLIGCGIGCGGIILLVLILLSGGFFFVRNLVRDFEDSEEVMALVVEKYGELTEFVPWPEGAVPAGRIETFLAVRVDTRLTRAQLEQSFQLLGSQFEAPDEERKSARRIFQTIGRSFRLVPEIADFYHSRSRALLEREMGIGEYTYLYCLIYYTWMGKNPEDGPDFALAHRNRQGWFEWDEKDFNDSEETAGMEMRNRVNKILLLFLQNQIKEARLQSGAFPAGWIERLDAEEKRLQDNPESILWETGLPESILESLEAFRSRLETEYSSTVNAVELGRSLYNP